MTSADQSLSARVPLHPARRFRGPDDSLAALFADLDPDIRSEWAWDKYRGTVAALARTFGLKRLIEIGGGRDPLLSPSDVGLLGVEYTLNDISAEELKHAPPGFKTARFDVAGDLSACGIEPASYDFAFSRMVFEHVKDVRRAWRNLHEILAPGGVAFAFIPTLYALPYVANRLIPERLSQKLVKLLYPHRTDSEDPKFPAYYDCCFASERKVEPVLRAAGFDETLIVPFYGHAYFEAIPLAREVDAGLTALAIRMDWRALAPYAYIVARKRPASPGVSKPRR